MAITTRLSRTSPSGVDHERLKPGFMAYYRTQTTNRPQTQPLPFLTIRHPAWNITRKSVERQAVVKGNHLVSRKDGIAGKHILPYGLRDHHDTMKMVVDQAHPITIDGLLDLPHQSQVMPSHLPILGWQIMDPVRNFFHLVATVARSSGVAGDGANLFPSRRENSLCSGRLPL